jgi:HEAT repeat protein
MLLKQALAELRDVNKEKRRTAVMKLGMAGGEQAVLTLISLVRNHSEDLLVRGRAALMLGKLGDARAVEPLIEALFAPGYQTRVHAAESLGRLGDARAIPPLLQVVQTESDPFRGAALAALRAIGYREEDTEAAPEPLAW